MDEPLSDEARRYRDECLWQVLRAALEWQRAKDELDLLLRRLGVGQR